MRGPTFEADDRLPDDELELADFIGLSARSVVGGWLCTDVLFWDEVRGEGHKLQPEEKRFKLLSSVESARTGTAHLHLNDCSACPVTT